MLASRRVAIVGGGVTGLAAAYDLERLTDAEIDLYESGDRLGGKLQTQMFGELLVEQGPDCFFSRKAGILELVQELGIEHELIAPQRKEFFLFIDKRLHRVPGGLVTMSHLQPLAITNSTFLSDAAKTRALAEAEQPMGTTPDESIRSFFTRRFGPEFCRLIAEPLLAGTHGGDADRLSMAALYPAYFRLEREFGSLAAGMNRGEAKETTSQSSFLSFRTGMQQIVRALVSRLGRTRVHLNTPVLSLAQVKADKILLATPANHAAALVPPEVRPMVQRIPRRSSVIVTLAYDRAAIGHSLEGTGFLVPPGEHSSVTGCTWSSEKWPGRAPQGTVLLRVFMRGTGISLAAQADSSPRVAHQAVASILDIAGEPTYSSVTQWKEGLPQYEIGHRELVEQIRALLARDSRIHIAGTSYGGVGVPDCLRQGRAVARAIAQELSGKS